MQYNDRVDNLNAMVHKDKGAPEKIKELASEIKWEPEFTKQRLDDWANFIEWDWIISRNRIFGTPIPFWYCEKCDFIASCRIKSTLPVDPTKDKAASRKVPEMRWQAIGRERNDATTGSTLR